MTSDHYDIDMGRMGHQHKSNEGIIRQLYTYLYAISIAVVDLIPACNGM
jgi:hypothetical protein